MLTPQPPQALLLSIPFRILLGNHLLKLSSPLLFQFLLGFYKRESNSEERAGVLVFQFLLGFYAGC